MSLGVDIERRMVCGTERRFLRKASMEGIYGRYRRKVLNDGVGGRCRYYCFREIFGGCDGKSCMKMMNNFWCEKSCIKMNDRIVLGGVQCTCHKTDFLAGWTIVVGQQNSVC